MTPSATPRHTTAGFPHDGAPLPLFWGALHCPSTAAHKTPPGSPCAAGRVLTVLCCARNCVFVADAGRRSRHAGRMVMCVAR